MDPEPAPTPLEPTPQEGTPAAPLETPPIPDEEPPPSPEATEGQASPEPAVPPAATSTVETPASPQPAQPNLKSFLEKALESIQFRKKAKLEKIMKLAGEKHSITNDQVQKLLRVSDATATRYLSALVRQGRLKQLGVRGSARYEPIIGSIPTV